MLDFATMRHEGEPPARLLAQVQMRLKEHKLPSQLAGLLAPYMAGAEDLDDEALATLTAVLDVFALHDTPTEEATSILEAAIAELQAGDEGDGAPDDGEEMTALHRPRQSNARGLLGAVIAQFRQKGPPVSRHTGVGRDLSREGQRARMVADMADGLQARIDRRHTPTRGRQYASMTLGDMVMSCVRATGQRPMNTADAIRMAHTTSDFPQILEGALGNTIARRMEQVTPGLARASHEVEAQDYRMSTRLDLSASGIPQEIGEGGEVKSVTIDESGERNPTPRDFGAIFSLSNKAIANDNLGMLTQIASKMQQGATERLRSVLLEPLLANGGLGHNMSDGQPVFDSSHGNLATTGSAPTVASLSSMIEGLRSQRGKQGEYYATEPFALVVPPKQETPARQLLAEINATKLSDVNPFSGTLEIIVEIGLTDPLAWYLIGNPANVDGLAHCYVNGQRTPRVESKLGWTTLGTEFRLVWALDARFVSYASWYKNPGA